MKEHQAALSAIGTRITQCTESSRRAIDEVLPEFTITASAEVPTMISVLQSTVRPDKFTEYMNLVKTEIFPAAKKSGLKEFSVATERFGGPNTLVVSVSGINAYADIDEGFGVEEALGKEGYQHLLQKARPLIIESERDIFRYLPDLSYLPPTPAK